MSTFVPGAGIGRVSIISRSPDKLDIFAVGLDGKVYTAAWEPGDTSWRGWWRIDGVETAPCAPVTAISRSTDKLDIFVVGLDGHVCTAAWEPGFGWRGWWRIGDVSTTLHAPVSAVSRSADKLDIFVVSLDGYICTAAWQPEFTGWQGWGTLGIGTNSYPPGAPVCAISKAPDEIDIFAVGLEGTVDTAVLRPGDAGVARWFGPSWVGDLKAHPRTPVSAVSRSSDQLDLFLVGLDGYVYTTPWNAKDPYGVAWRPIGSHAPPIGTMQAPVSVVSRSAGLVDIFLVGQDGNVYTAGCDADWGGPWQISGFSTLPGTPVAAVSRSTDRLDLCTVGLDGHIYAAAWAPDSAGWQGWWRAADLVTGMTDPYVDQWKDVGTAFKSENKGYSSEAQGMTTDGGDWFLSSNGSKTIRRYRQDFELLGEIKVPLNAHIGAPGCFQGSVYVPVQDPFGVWKTDKNFSTQKFTPAEGGQRRFPWCDVNPLNGRLYTVEDIYNDQKMVLLAYDFKTLERRPEDDIKLGPTPAGFNSEQGGQGGVFTRHGRIIISRSGPNTILCFSSLTGHCFGGRKLGDYNSSGSEVEGVTVRPWQFGSTPAHVHVLELDNDFWTKDDCYLHSYNVPEPDRL
jgi:hypothetical protein